jgi:superfamily II DNA/RNA helicase
MFPRLIIGRRSPRKNFREKSRPRFDAPPRPRTFDAVLTDAFAGLQKLVLPDRWQAEAIRALEAGRDVVIDAPTGAGKTYVFERWAEQTNFARRALFTVPTRALANDKYAEWRARGWRVGIITGDITIDPTAPLVVATLEAVQSQIAPAHPTRPNDLAPFHLLVIDEYHWLADTARGNHYEGALLSAPPELQLLLLSGAVANPHDVAAWLQRLGRRVEVVSHRERPVPLEEVEVDDLIAGLPRTIEGFWSRRIAGALREGLGPVLIFAPHRHDAERLARQFAREVPLAEPLSLTPEQEQLAGPALAKLLRQRVAYHHSGLAYAQRAGLIEPLAKAGQLRAVFATLGLSAGINFSLRSVLITASHFNLGPIEHEIPPHDLLQMVGRAGRRGLDEYGFVLVSSSTPRLRRAAPLRLKRAAPLPWAFFLRQLYPGAPTAALAAASATRFFTDTPVAFGAETTAALPPETELPCHHRTDTGRARLVRRERDPFLACLTCTHRPACLALSVQPTPLWQWQRVGVLDRDLQLTARGAIIACYLGPEGLALAAALEDRRYPLDALLFDCANLFAADRFAGTHPRRLGRLAALCERTYRRTTIEGYLHEGLPPGYGFGASEVVSAIVSTHESTRQVVDAQEFAGRGDVDRLLTEWRSLLRQTARSAPITLPADIATRTDRRAAAELFLAERWDTFRALCRTQLATAKADTLPALPPLTPDQRRPVNHRFTRAGSFVSSRAPG